MEWGGGRAWREKRAGIRVSLPDVAGRSAAASVLQRGGKGREGCVAEGCRWLG